MSLLGFSTLSLYLFRLYFRYFFLLLAIFVLILAIGNAFSLFQILKSSSLPIVIFITAVFAKVPYLVNENLILMSFIATLFLLLRLAKTKELLIILSSGLSFWSLITPIITAVFVIANIFIFFIIPLSTPLLIYHDNIIKYKNKKNISYFDKSLLINKEGFFKEYLENNYQVIHFKKINKKIKNITILKISKENNNLLRRIEAEEAEISNNQINMKQAVILDYENNSVEKQYSQISKNVNLPTLFSFPLIVNMLSEPYFLNIWQIQEILYYSKLINMNFKNHAIFYYKQLLKSFAMVSTSLLAASFFSIRDYTRLQNKKIISKGLLIVVFVYFFFEFSSKFLMILNFNIISSLIFPIILVTLTSIWKILLNHEN